MAKRALFATDTGLCQRVGEFFEDVPSDTSDPTKKEIINWLNELNYLTETKLFVFCDFHVISLNEKELSASIKGEKYNKLRHGPFKEIKSITYHGNDINKISNQYECLIVCDI